MDTEIWMRKIHNTVARIGWLAHNETGACSVYIYRCCIKPGGCSIKIGVSQNTDKRERGFVGAVLLMRKRVASREHALAVESALHRAFAGQRLSRERGAQYLTGRGGEGEFFDTTVADQAMAMLEAIT